MAGACGTPPSPHPPPLIRQADEAFVPTEILHCNSGWSLASFRAGARRAAEQMAGNQGIKAVGGWSGDAEVATYTSAVDQAALAEATSKRVIAADLANLGDRLAKSNADPSEKKR